MQTGDGSSTKEPTGAEALPSPHTSPSQGRSGGDSVAEILKLFMWKDEQRKQEEEKRDKQRKMDEELREQRFQQMMIQMLKVQAEGQQQRLVELEEARRLE